MIKKRALITGITGMVGSHLADFLLKNTDWEIYGMCRLRSPLENINHLIDRINKKDRIHLLYGDLNDQISLHDVIRRSKPDYIFHLAAHSYSQTSFESPLGAIEANLQGTVKILEIVRKMPEIKPVIHICSSSEIFGKVAKENLPIAENCSLNPTSPYAISKAGVDFLGRYYADAHKINIITTRLFPHTGPRRGDVFAESTFAKQIAMIEKGLISPTVKVGNLEALRNFADVRDAVRAFHMLATKELPAGEYYNIGGSFSCTIREMLNYLISISTMKDRIKIEIDPNRLRTIDSDLHVPDISKFSNCTGWKPEITFEKTMLDLLNYWRDRVSKGEKFLTR